jgi:deoxycytidylate deaminase
MNDHTFYFQKAGEEAIKSTCLRAKCGAVVVLNGEVIGRGYNAPPKNDISKRKCEENFSHSTKPKSDKTCCVHAEWNAILDALRGRDTLSQSAIYFTRVDKTGKLLVSGDPYCTVCSRLALEIGIETFVLWHEDGIRIYPTQEYNDISYAFHQIQEYNSEK